MADKSNVYLFPVPLTTDRQPPPHLMRECDYGFQQAILSLEAQLGTVEAYNRLCDAAHQLRAQIDVGLGRKPNPV